MKISTKSDRSDYPSATQIKWFRQQLSTWGVANRRDFPWRKTTDSYHLLVAESGSPASMGKIG